MNTFDKNFLVVLTGLIFLHLLIFLPEKSYASPVPEITANNSSESITLSPNNSLSISVSLNTGSETGQMADWWLVIQTPFGWSYYDTSEGWKPGFHVTFQGGLIDLSPVPVFNYSGLPEGFYTFYFAVDLTPDGEVTSDQLYYDSITAQVSSDSAAGPDPEYSNITWTLPAGASELRLSLPADIDDIFLGSIGGFGLHSGGHIEGLDHVWIHIKKGTPVRSWADGYVEDVRLSGMVELGEYAITIDYGQNLIGIHMEVGEPLVEKYTNVTRGQIVGYGMTFGGNDSSAEFGLIDKGRSDGVKAYYGGVYVSPFDYLNDIDKRRLVDAYKEEVLDPYREDGTKPSGWEWEPYEPYLTNSIFIHKENRISGVWYLISERWEPGYPNDILTFIEVNNPYFTGSIVYAENDVSEGSYDIKGTYEVDYEKGQVKINNTRGPDYYGIFEIDESGERAKLKIEYQEGSFPSVFTGNALTYIQRGNLTRREDAQALGVLD